MVRMLTLQFSPRVKNLNIHISSVATVESSLVVMLQLFSVVQYMSNI